MSLLDWADWHNRYHILNTYDHDVELRGLVPSDPVILCQRPLKLPDSLDAIYKSQRTVTSSTRVNVIFHIPQLSLLVVGSQVGRVMLITPTKLAQNPPHHSPSPVKSPPSIADASRPIAAISSLPEITQSRRSKLPSVPIAAADRPPSHAFRVDRILPTAQDDAKGISPLRTLLGVAVGPVPDGACPASVKIHGHGVPFTMNPVYRLMLHYRNHSIVTYEISRNQKGDLVIF